MYLNCYLIRYTKINSRWMADLTKCDGKPIKLLRHLVGSMGWAPDFGLGHDLTVREFKPHVVPCADSSEPGTCFKLCLPLFLPVPCSHLVSLSLKNKKLKLKLKKIVNLLKENIGGVPEWLSRLSIQLRLRS